MKQSKIILIVGVLISAFMLSSLLTSCKVNSYAKKRKEEKAVISNYLKDHNIQVSTDSLLCDTLQAPWPENFYFKTYRGAYVRITKRDRKKAVATTGKTLVLRYIMYNLPNDQTPVFDNLKSREGEYFVYTKNGTAPCIGWNDAIPFMRHDGECEMIIESVIGTENQQKEVYAQKVNVVSFTVSNN